MDGINLDPRKHRFDAGLFFESGADIELVCWECGRPKAEHDPNAHLGATEEA